MVEPGNEYLWYLAFALIGVVAGFVNTLAGGGSLLTLPVLMLAGLPPHIANASNRVAVFLQGVAGTTAFDREGRLDRSNAFAISAPTLIGSLGGAVTAAYLPNDILKPVLLTAMMTIAVVLLVRPTLLAPPPEGTPRTLSEAPMAIPVLVAVGFYGGFAQAGVGIFLLAAFGGMLRYDLVRANALKLLVTTAFTGLALLVFIGAGQVRWIPGLALAVGMVTGARIAVRFAISTGQETLRKFVLGVAIVSCIAAWVRG
ncbi:MAG: TSUP family transporter [Candidatus Binatia bacterium]|nr:TSUP family transporter [Candidatus Binatia bacterium]